MPARMNASDASGVGPAVESTAAHADQSQAHQDFQSTGHKRRRILHACQACRQRKSRCDGVRPACRLCTHHGLTCQYDTAARPRAQADPPESRISAGLETRLQNMEGILRALVTSRTHVEATRDRALPSSNIAAASLDPASIRAQPLQASCVLQTSSATLSSMLQQTSGSASLEDDADGMASIAFSDETSSGAFGKGTHRLNLTMHVF
jgi:hypothetical protein